ncbi:MAG: PAS domain-containing protein, partial [Flexibacteraceae bacterium]
LSEFLGHVPTAIFVCEQDPCAILDSFGFQMPDEVLSELCVIAKDDKEGLIKRAVLSKEDILADFSTEKNNQHLSKFLLEKELKFGLAHPVYSEKQELLGCIFLLLKNNNPLGQQQQTMLQMASKVLTLCATRDKAMNSLYKQAQVFENMYDAIILTDSNNIIRELNPVTEKLFGYSKSDLLGQDLLALKLFEKNNKLEKLIRYASDNQHNELRASNLKFVDELHFKNVNGTGGVAEVAVISINSGDNLPSGTLVVVRDVTNSKKVESALSSSESKLVALVENTDDIIFSLDKELRLITSNTATKNFYQTYLGTEIVPGDIFDLPNAPILTQKLIHQFKKTLKGESIRQEIHLPLGPGFYFSV